MKRKVHRAFVEQLPHAELGDMFIAWCKETHVGGRLETTALGCYDDRKDAGIKRSLGYLNKSCDAEHIL